MSCSLADCDSLMARTTADRDDGDKISKYKEIKWLMKRHTICVSIILVFLH